MQSLLRFIVTGIVVLGVILYMVTYTVRFTETAVVTTFGRAGENSVVTTPGFQFRWPYPIQSVVKYDTRQRVLETRAETHTTVDNRQVIVTAFMTYRVSDPLKFFQKFGGSGNRPQDHVRSAEGVLASKLRTAVAEVSKFRLDEILQGSAPQGSESGLARLEKSVEDALRKAGADGTPGLADYGIEPLTVGVSRVQFPQDTTKAVFERMKATRQRLASEAQSKGTAEAQRIRDQAQADAEAILKFAEARAQAIEGRGQREAAVWLAAQGETREKTELALFLMNINAMRQLGAGRPITLVLPTTIPGMNMMMPNALDLLPPGKLPTINVPGGGVVIDPAGRPANAQPSNAQPAAPAASKGGER